MTDKYEDRCKISPDCLPDAPYRKMLEALHAEMIAERDALRAKLAEIEKDAERYRAGREAEYAGLMPQFREGKTWTEAMDAAYDAAIAGALAAKKETNK